MDETTQAQEVISWAPEVIADSSGKWSRNSLRFATQEEAEASARELAGRWWLVTDYRAAPAQEPVNYRFVEGKNQPLES
jgi:hypothetical protein